MATKNIIAALAVVVSIAAPSTAASIDWGTSYSDALARAQTTGKPVLLYVDADYCVYCKQMDREAFVDSRAVLLSHLYLPCKVDGEHEGKPLIKKYGIKEYPYEAVLDAAGNVLTPAPEYMDPDKYVKTLAAALPSADLDRLKADHANPTSAGGLVVVEAEMGDVSGAEAAMSSLQSMDPSADITAAAYHALGDAYVDGKQYDKAAAALKTASDTLGDCHEAVGIELRLAECWGELGNTAGERSALTTVGQMKSADRGEKKDAENRLRALAKG